MRHLPWGYLSYKVGPAHGRSMDLTRFRGHLNDWIEGVHDGEQSGSIYPGIQGANGGSGALRTHPGVFGEGVRPGFLVDLAMGQAGRASRGQGRWRSVVFCACGVLAVAARVSLSLGC